MAESSNTCDADHPRIARLEKQVRRLQATIGVFAVLLLAVPLLAFFQEESPSVLRVRGLIVEDGEGRERILIGAPLPDAAHRIRTDPERARAVWGDRFPDMSWYDNLDHSANGILILDEEGHDRIVIGDPTPDPNIGKRIAPSVGINVNDENGQERSGWGYFPDLDQVGFGLDRQSGEGLNLFLQNDGTSGMLIRSEGGAQSTFVGQAPAGHFLSGTDDDFSGLVHHDESGPRLSINGQGETPRIDLRDSEGELLLRLPDDL